MHVVLSEEVQEVQNIHASPGLTELARQQLEALDWGVLEGRRVQDLDAFIEQHGALNVLYAVWCSRGQQIQNPPAFVTWWLRQGHRAPDGWLPAELRIPDPPQPAALAPIEPPAPEPTEVQAPNATPGPVEAPETPAELQLLWADILAYVEPRVRPSSFQAWFEPLVLVGAQKGDTLRLWAPSAAHADWVEECYDRLLRGGLARRWATRAIGLLFTPTKRQYNHATLEEDVPIELHPCL